MSAQACRTVRGAGGNLQAVPSGTCRGKAEGWLGGAFQMAVVWASSGLLIEEGFVLGCARVPRL